MWIRRTLLIAILLVVAAGVQVSVLARLTLPGAVPDLVLVTVIAIALSYGPLAGAVSGFAGGLLLDLAPPTDGAVGMLALIGMIVGYLTAVIVEPRDRTLPVVLAMVGGSAIGGVLVYALGLAVTGSPRVSWTNVPGLALSAGLYAALLSMMVVPFVAWIVRRVTPEAVL